MRGRPPQTPLRCAELFSESDYPFTSNVLHTKPLFYFILFTLAATSHYRNWGGGGSIATERAYKSFAQPLEPIVNPTLPDDCLLEEEHGAK